MAESKIMNHIIYQKVTGASTSINAQSEALIDIRLTGENAIPSEYNIGGIIAFETGNTGMLCESVSLNNTRNIFGVRVFNLTSATKNAQPSLTLALVK